MYVQQNHIKYMYVGYPRVGSIPTAQYLHSINSIVVKLLYHTPDYQYLNPEYDTTYLVKNLYHKNICKTNIYVLPSKNQALFEYCTLVSKLKHC